MMNLEEWSKELFTADLCRAYPTTDASATPHTRFCTLEKGRDEEERIIIQKKGNPLCAI
jgi:hypothetical protein